MIRRRKTRYPWINGVNSYDTEVVICGAGIAGIAAAYFLTLQGVDRIKLVDERPPLTLTSDKSTEAYRNWWPGPDNAMISLMDHSIDLLEKLALSSGNIFKLNRRGYLYVTADPDRIPEFIKTAERAQEQGAGPLRIHRGHMDDPPYIPIEVEAFTDQPTGCDLLLDGSLIQNHFPYLTRTVLAALHTRRCGWFSGQQLGMYLLEEAQNRGVEFIRGRIEGVKLIEGRIHAVEIRQDDTTCNISTRNFVVAAGPMLQEVGRMIGVELPVFCERHLKIAMKDTLGAMPRNAPLLIWDDPQRIPWMDDEKELLAETEEGRQLMETFPPGVHTRPEGGPESTNILILWPYDLDPVEPTFPVPTSPEFPEVALRGLSTMIPGMKAYIDRIPKPLVDGGYYVKTQENRLLCGPLSVPGAFVLGALAGYGLMAAPAAGELLAAHITGSELPPYSAAFSIDRYQDPVYQQKLKAWGPSTQL
ncbi:MAG: FAD-dependent oxidoreductase [Anaerolineales bacterium]|nr:FAD-dependent oxidoreductase [Anaerolineales bacterium]